jgi:hypothetical protein
MHAEPLRGAGGGGADALPLAQGGLGGGIPLDKRGGEKVPCPFAKIEQTEQGTVAHVPVVSSL